MHPEYTSLKSYEKNIQIAVTRPGREIAADMTCHDLVNVQNILAGRMSGVMVSRWYEPKEITQDVWWWLTGR